MLQVESAKFEKGVQWLREILYRTVFTKERLEVIAQKIVNEVARAKRSGRGVVGYAMEGIRFVQESNQRNGGILKQHKFLSQLLEKLATNSEDVILALDNIRKTITKPSNLALYFAGNLEVLKSSAAEVINNFLPEELSALKQQKR